MFEDIIGKDSINEEENEQFFDDIIEFEYYPENSKKKLEEISYEELAKEIEKIVERNLKEVKGKHGR